MNLIERRKRKLIIFTVLCILVFALFIGVLVRNGKVAAATCPECTSHPTLSAATCEKPATCPQCGYQTGSALGHKFVRFNVGSGDGCVVQMGCQRCGCINQVNFGNHKWAYGSYFNNGTKCMVKMRCQRCGIIRTLSREHTYVTKYDETNHWEACSRCGVIKTDSKEEHMYDENGKCKCGVTKQAEETCEHEYATKYDATNHWEECSKCGFIKADSIAEHAYDENGKCKCGATKQAEETCEHEYATKYDATNHWEECSKCGFIKANSIAEHAYDENGKCKCGATKQTEETCEHTYTTKQDETYHWEECSKCGFIKADSIAEHAYDENGKCKCGAIKQAEETCEHEYVTKYDETNHWETCSKCGFIKANSIAEHAYDENGKCKCGATKQTEETCEHTYTTKQDETYHWEECSKCGFIKADSIAEHAYDENGKCKCGATKQTEEICEHEYVTKYDATNHWEECSKCGFIKVDSIAEHAYDENGKCKCGAIKQAEETCEHEYVTKYDETNHWEECSKCKGIKTNSKEEHKGIKWIDEGNETHSGTCSICKFKLKEEHSYANGKCTKCGAKESSENETCEHNYVEKHDETYHWEECLKCNALKKETLQTHKYQEYTDNKNGTHTTTCTICGYKLTEEHLEECEKCNKQANTGNNGNKEDDNTGNNDDNKGNNNIDKNDSKDEDNTNNDKKDNTAIDKNLPYTGTSKIITLVIIILSALITLTVFKLKKYKGIK